MGNPADFCGLTEMREDTLVKVDNTSKLDVLLICQNPAHVVKYRSVPEFVKRMSTPAENDVQELIVAMYHLPDNFTISTLDASLRAIDYFCKPIAYAGPPAHPHYLVNLLNTVNVQRQVKEEFDLVVAVYCPTPNFSKDKLLQFLRHVVKPGGVFLTTSSTAFTGPGFGANPIDDFAKQGFFPHALDVNLTATASNLQEIHLVTQIKPCTTDNLNHYIHVYARAKQFPFPEPEEPILEPVQTLNPKNWNRVDCSRLDEFVKQIRDNTEGLKRCLGA